MTKREMFEATIAIVEASAVDNRQEIVDGLTHEIELLDRKKASSTLTKTQKENENVMAEIISALQAVGRAVTVTELMKANETMAQYSNQKLTSLLSKLQKEGLVQKNVEHKKSYYFV